MHRRRAGPLSFVLAALGAACAPAESPAPPAPSIDAPAADEQAPRVSPASNAAAADTDTVDWLEQAEPARGIRFRYPADLGTRYIRPVDWPPMVQLVDGPLECTAAGSEIARAGRTEPATIAGRSYCVTRASEGAAGSVYTSYAFAFERDGRVAILTFSVRAPQCGNYDERERQECEAERPFDPGPTIDRIAATLELPPP